MSSADNATREVAVRQSLVRHRLLMGGERQATIWNFAIAFIIVIITKSLPGLLAAVSVAAIVQTLLILLAKWDPQAIAVITRARKQQDFYGNGASLDAEPSSIHGSGQAPLALLLGRFRARKGKNDAEH